jgi:hypothetical protein
VIHGDLELLDLDGTTPKSDGAFDGPGAGQAGGAAPGGEAQESGYRFRSRAHDNPLVLIG